jgi:hypothetical protein
MTAATAVPGSLDKKWKEDATFLVDKRWHLLLLFQYNEPDTAVVKADDCAYEFARL